LDGVFIAYKIGIALVEVAQNYRMWKWFANGLVLDAGIEYQLLQKDIAVSESKKAKNRQLTDYK